MAQPTCFVVTGFGTKTDFQTGRVLNLDQTFRQLVQPACDAVGVNCFRAIDANLTGQIDAVMYRWIYEADMVIADLSTLNANVFYELGVRHAQRPNTTVIIAESLLLQRIPFDLSSFVIHQYEHGGTEIAAEEQQRFVGHLAGVLRKIMAQDEARLRASPQLPAESDSPVFKSLTGMTPPRYAPESFMQAPEYVPPEARARQGASASNSLAGMIETAERAISRKDFSEAVALLKDAIGVQTGGKPGRKPDPFLVQRLALATYKAGEAMDAEGKPDTVMARAALHEAEALLVEHCAPRISTDPETLGLSGAINKRLFELTGDQGYLDLAIRFYERGFYIRQDYYNGINAAFMHTLRATLLEDRFEAIVSYGHANMIRQQVVRICEDLIGDEDAFATRGDKAWVYATLAEAYQGMGRPAEEARLESKINSVASPAIRSSYLGQKAKLAAAIEDFTSRYPEIASAVPAGSANGHRIEAGQGGAITIIPDVAAGRVLKSIDVSLRLDYQ